MNIVIVLNSASYAATAFRRQESEVPFTNFAPFSAVDPESEMSYGSLAYDSVNGWIVTTDDSASASITYSGTNLVSRDAGEAQRLTYASKDVRRPYNLMLHGSNITRC